MIDMVKQYVEDVLSHVRADERTVQRLAEDLESHIRDSAREHGEREAIRRMGDPKELAASLMDALYDDKQQVVRELLSARQQLNQYRDFEYKSRATLFGLPLVHVCFSRAGRVRVAKGIIAIGGVAVGGVAIGGAAAGVIAIGGVSLGLMCFGGLALALLMGFGGLATGLFAIGGLAFGCFSLGGVAAASQVAVGGEAFGKVALGQQGAHGTLYQAMFSESEWPSKQQMIEIIRTHLPELKDWVIRIVTAPFA